MPGRERYREHIDFGEILSWKIGIPFTFWTLWGGFKLNSDLFHLSQIQEFQFII